MKPSTWILLILSNVFWALNPVFMKVLLKSYEPFQVSWIRYASALAGMLVILLLKRLKSPLLFKKVSKKAGLGMLGAGLATFFLSPLLQIKGLSQSRATDNALLIAIEPLMTVFMAWIILGEKLKVHHIACFIMSTLGFIFLSGGISGSAFFIGNLLILISLIGEGAFSIFGRKLLKTHSADQIFAVALGFGVFLLSILLTLNTGFPKDLFSSQDKVFAILWMGPIGTALTYWFWMKALETANVASVCLTLFIQPLLGAFAGPLFLNEHLDLLQWTGASVILLSLLIQIRFDLKK